MRVIYFSWGKKVAIFTHIYFLWMTWWIEGSITLLQVQVNSLLVWMDDDDIFCGKNVYIYFFCGKCWEKNWWCGGGVMMMSMTAGGKCNFWWNMSTWITWWWYIEGKGGDSYDDKCFFHIDIIVIAVVKKMENLFVELVFLVWECERYVGVGKIFVGIGRKSGKSVRIYGGKGYILILYKK